MQTSRVRQLKPNAQMQAMEYSHLQFLNYTSPRSQIQDNIIAQAPLCTEQWCPKACVGISIPSGKTPSRGQLITAELLIEIHNLQGALTLEISGLREEPSGELCCVFFMFKPFILHQTLMELTYYIPIFTGFFIIAIKYAQKFYTYCFLKLEKSLQVSFNLLPMAAAESRFLKDQ